MKLLLFFFALFVITGVGCESTPDRVVVRKNGYSEPIKSREDSLMRQVMQGHDAGMARMGKITIAIAALEHLSDSLRNDGNIQYQMALKDLRNAASGMNNWMNEFKLDTLVNDPPERLKYLEEEIKKVTVVKQQIFGSLQKADSILISNAR